MPKKKKANPIHGSSLQMSVLDDIELCRAVQSRFLDVLHLHLRLKGEPLSPPKDLDSSIFLWRKMAVRHKTGDYRHTDGELRALQAVAQWTLDTNSLLRNQETKQITWR